MHFNIDHTPPFTFVFPFYVFRFALYSHLERSTIVSIFSIPRKECHQAKQLRSLQRNLEAMSCSKTYYTFDDFFLPKANHLDYSVIGMQYRYSDFLKLYHNYKKYKTINRGSKCYLSLIVCTMCKYHIQSLFILLET